MADGKNLLAKLIEVFEGDATLQALSATGIRVKISRFSPVGNVYPQICISMEEGPSELIFPVSTNKLSVTVWVGKEKEPYKNLTLIGDRIKKLINRKNSSLNEINTTADIGLRVLNILKDGSEYGFDGDIGLHYREFIFEAKISEDESFVADVAGDKAWV